MTVIHYRLLLFQVSPDKIFRASYEEEGDLQARRMQRSPGQCGQEEAEVHARPVHNTRRRAVALDAYGLLDEFHAFLDHVRLDLVFHLVHTWRPGLPERNRKRKPDGGIAAKALYNQHKWLHVLFPVLRGNAAHDRLWQPVHQRGVSSRDIHHVLTKYHGRLHSGEFREIFFKNSLKFFSPFRHLWWESCLRNSPDRRKGPKRCSSPDAL